MRVLYVSIAISVLLFTSSLDAQWVRTNDGSDGKIHCLAVSGTNLFAANWEQGVFPYSDNGTSWDGRRTGSGSPNLYPQALAVSGTNLFAGTWGGVFLSTDNGMSWSKASTGLTSEYPYALAVSGTNLFAGTLDHGVFRSTNNGTSWTALGLSNSHVNAFAVSGTHLFAGTDGGVFLSTDNGSSWKAVSTGLPNDAVFALAVSGTNLFAGTYRNGVFLSTDNGTSWNATGLTSADVRSLVVCGTNLFASGRDRGVGLPRGIFLSTNNGTYWTAENTGLGNTDVDALAVLGTNLFAGTWGGGVWRRPLSELRTTLSLTSGDNQSGTISTALANPFVVTVTDAGGNPVSGVRVDFTITSVPTGASGQSLGRAQEKTNSSGLASSILTLGNKPGMYTVTATSSGPKASSVTFTATATPDFTPTVAILKYPSNGTTSHRIFDYQWNVSASPYPLFYRLTVMQLMPLIKVQDDSVTSTSAPANWTIMNPGQLYQWNVTAISYDPSHPSQQWSSSSASWSFTCSWVPLPPSILVATPVSASEIDLSWTDNSNDEGGFTIERAPAGTKSFLQIAAVAANTSTYQDKGLSSSTSYIYRVRAFYSSYFSGYSNNATVIWPPSPPTLGSPSSGASGVSTNLRLTWNDFSKATSYQLQVSTAADFSTTIFDRSNINGTSRQVSGLANNTLYYWRVNATNAGGTSAWSRVSSFTTILAAPKLASPASGATAIPLTPTFSWAAPTGAVSYQLQVSALADFSTKIFDQINITGTSQQVSGLGNNTLYYWRVNATNTGGTSAWSTTWSFTTILAAPTFASPASGAAGVSIAPTLSWNASAGAASYQLQVSIGSDFSTTAFDQSSITGTAQQISGLANNTLYYWRVNATNTGGTSVWSSVWTFTTILAAPTLASPANAATGISLTPTLSWNATSGATSYQLQVSITSDFSTTAFDQSGITETSQQVSGLANNTLYYWRVNATNTGGTSAWSSVWSFTTLLSGLPAPTLASPANGATGQPTSETFSWNVVPGATSYRLQISLDQAFTTPLANLSPVMGTSLTFGGLASNTTYYWRVSASNSSFTSPWSEVRSFTTLVIILPPASTSWGFIKNFTTLTGGSGVHGIAVDPAGKVWIAPYGNTDSVLTSTGYRMTRALYIYTPDGLPAPISPIKVITVSGMADTLYTTSLGLSTDPNGNILYTTSSVMYRINYRTGNGMTRVVPQGSVGSPNLTAPASDQSGNVFVGRVNPNNAIQIFDPNFNFLGNVTTSTTSFSRTIAVSGDGKNVYWPEYTMMSLSRFNSPSGPGGTYTNTSSLFNGLATESMTWNPKTGYLWVSSGSSANPPVAPYPIMTWYGINVATGAIVDTIGWYQTPGTMSGRPRAIAFTPTGDTAYVGCYGLYSNYIQMFIKGQQMPTLAAPTLATPANGATGQSINLTLQWNAVSGATMYDVQLATNASFSPYWAESTPIAQTSFTFYGLSMGTTYYWRAKAINGPVNSAWSQVWSFTTSPPSLATPTLVSPANNATNQMISLVLQWNAVSGATSYVVHLSSDPNSPSFRSYGTTQASVNVESLDPSTVYYWKVEATDGTGFSLWSQVWSFTTSSVLLAAPTLSVPANGATGQAVNLTVQWNAVPGATMYDVQVATNTLFNPYWAASTAIAQTSFTFYGLSANTTYYWRAVAMNASAVSPWSQVWSFTTSSVLLAAPTLSVPANGATGVGTSQNFVWYAIPGIYSYRLQISDDPLFASTFFDQSNLYRGWVVSGLALNHTYYWRVNASSGGAPSDWSETWSFTTRGAIQDLPQSNSFAIDANLPVDGTWIQSTVAGVTHPDGKVRIVAGTRSTGSLYVYVNNGTNYVEEWSQVVAPGAQIIPVAIGDADNDGKPEIVVSIWPSGGPSDKKIHLYRWNGTGYAQVLEQQLAFIDWGYLTVAIKDLDGDGKNELVATANQINVLRFSQATNTFQSVWTSPSTAYNFSNAIQVSVGDVDGDNRPEIVASVSIDPFSPSPNTEVGLVIAGFDGSTYALKAELRGFAHGLGGVAIGDVDGDGKAEMLSGVFNYAIGSYPIYLVKYSGIGYTINQIASSPWGMYQARAADIDGDGIAEANIFRSTNNSYYAKYVAGTYQISVVQHNGGVFGDLADADQDGRAEILASGQVVSWVPPLVAPVLASPANGATGVATNPTLQWNSQSGATSYRVQISMDQTFASWFGDSGPISQTSYSFSNLSFLTTYYWRVIASNSSSTSPPSAVWSFTTSPLSGPRLALPANESTGIALAQDFVWYPVSGATSYRFQISTSPMFLTTIVDEPNAWLGYSAFSLALNTTYYWRVGASQGAASPTWSETWNFTTFSSFPVVAVSDSFHVDVALRLDENPNRAVIAGVTRPDGKVRIVAGTRETGSLFVYLFDGTTYQKEWSGVISPNAEIIPTAVGDCDNDGLPEILVNIWPRPGYGPSDGKIHMYRWDGSAYSQVLEQQIGAYINWMSAALADVDGDGMNELILCDSQVSVFRYSTSAGTFQKIWSTSYPSRYFGTSLQVSVGDVDGDSHLEIVALPSVNQYDPNPSTAVGMVIIGCNGGTYAVKAELCGFAQGLGGAALGDFDGDKKMEIIAAVDNQNISTHDIYVIRYDGSSYVIQQIGTSFRGTFQIHAGDIDGDGTSDADILLNGYGTAFITYKSGHYQVSFTVGGGAVFGDVADTDQDGKAEILTASYSDLNVISWNPPLSGGTSTVHSAPSILSYISGLPDGAFKPPANERRHALIDKLSRSHSQYRSGEAEAAIRTISQGVISHLVLYGKPTDDLWLTDQITRTTLLRMVNELVTAMKNRSVIDDGFMLTDEDLASPIPTEYGLRQNYPNPFNPATQISFDLPKDGNVSLVVHNILGQEVARLADGYMPAGRYSKPFVADRLSAGVYYYVLTAGEYRSVKKMLLLK